jgi:Flp pilus assembly protein TadD
MMIAMLVRGCALALSLLIAQPALAAWHEASSDHFVIYADDKEANVRRYAENLERYHAAMAFLLNREMEPPSPSNRVVIYAVGSQRDVRDLANSRSRYIAGFYVPRAGASRAFVQNLANDPSGEYPSISTIVLLHEYAHHFLLSSSSFAMPRWLNEGAAEFFAASSFRKDGSVMIGRAAQHRAGELFYGDTLTVRDLVEADARLGNENRRTNSFYGYSWLLYHYLTFRTERAGQLNDYQRNLIAGMNSLEAGEAAFGDLPQLNAELQNYARSRKMMTFVLPSDKLRIRPVRMRTLPPGEAEIMGVAIRSQRGVNAEQAAELVTEARAIAARHPDDPGVLTALAEAEHDAGNDDAAIKAADHAIALDPTRANAYVQKGLALFRQAGEADNKAAAFARAMQPFSQLNGIENDHPFPLIYYYQSYTRQGAQPSENARAALERASQLAPFDLGLKLNVAAMLLGEGKIELARAFLQPVAVNPHGGELAARARQLMDQLAGLSDGVVPDAAQLGALAASDHEGDESEVDDEAET